MIGEPSGFAEAGSSKVVPTKTSFSSGESTTMVDTRLGLSCVLTVYRSGRAVSLPSPSTDISRTWSGPKECKHVKHAFRGGIGQGLGGAAPPLDGVSRGTDIQQRQPSIFAHGEAGDGVVAAVRRKQKLSIRDRMTLPAPSKAFGALSCR